MESESLIGSVPKHWEQTTLGEICARSGGDIQTGPFGSQLHAADYVTAGIPSIMPQNISQDRISTDDISYITLHDAERLARYRVVAGDIVYSRRGDVERRALVGQSENGWLCGTGCLRIRFGEDAMSHLFAFYYLGHPSVRAWVVRHAIGATMPNLNTATLNSLPVIVPPLDEQREIARILVALDDKIEANRRMNATLEATAQALFRSWFVDFDPVRAKAAGREPEGMDAATAALFPDGFEASALGDVPRGWRVSTIGEETRVVGGSTPSTQQPTYWDNGQIRWATPKDLSALQSHVLLDTERYITQDGLSQISSGLLPSGTVLLSSRAPVGYVALADMPVAINQGFVAMVCELSLPNYYVMQWTLANMEVIRSRANGTTFLEISRANFRTIPVLVPAEPILRQFSNAMAPLFQNIKNNLQANNTLAELRDTLLPKLLSGELRVGR